MERSEIFKYYTRYRVSEVPVLKLIHTNTRTTNTATHPTPFVHNHTALSLIFSQQVLLLSNWLSLISENMPSDDEMTPVQYLVAALKVRGLEKNLGPNRSQHLIALNRIDDVCMHQIFQT
jgi:hypothetical protein